MSSNSSLVRNGENMKQIPAESDHKGNFIFHLQGEAEAGGVIVHKLQTL